MATPDPKKMTAEEVSAWLMEQQMAAPEELQADFNTFDDLFERKLWHELTEAIVEFYGKPASAPQRLPIFRVFISKFDTKINQLRLADLALRASAEFQSSQERLGFLEAIAKKVNRPTSQDAYAFISIAAARALMELGDADEARRRLDDAERRLEQLDRLDAGGVRDPASNTRVFAAFYDTNAQYYQRRADFAAYYRNALLYLACIDVKLLSPAVQRSRAYNLALAALVSPTIYNFGELLLHPILDALTAKPAAKSVEVEDAGADAKDDDDGGDDEKINQDNSWLRDLLFAFNRGDLAAYEDRALAERVRSHQLLSKHARHLQQKLYLAALTEAVFRRPPHARAMSFAAIAAETRVRADRIEHLVMKALSLGLIRGTIDQVAQVAHIDWVQPKVLDMGQITGMRDRLKQWGSSVHELGTWIEGVGQDVWAA